jgi:hypothetical protein
MTALFNAEKFFFQRIIRPPKKEITLGYATNSLLINVKISFLPYPDPVGSDS